MVVADTRLVPIYVRQQLISKLSKVIQTKCARQIVTAIRCFDSFASIGLCAITGVGKCCVMCVPYSARCHNKTAAAIIESNSTHTTHRHKSIERKNEQTKAKKSKRLFMSARARRPRELGTKQTNKFGKENAPWERAGRRLDACPSINIVAILLFIYRCGGRDTQVTHALLPLTIAVSGVFVAIEVLPLLLGLSSRIIPILWALIVCAHVREISSMAGIHTPSRGGFFL